jgi:hypothetical protein
VRALRDAQHPYDQAMKIVLDEEMRKLGIQSVRVARQASDAVKGKWFTGNFALFVDMKKGMIPAGRFCVADARRA